jgi:hypothetical protein
MNSKLRPGRSLRRSLEASLNINGDATPTGEQMPITLVDNTITPSENSPSLWARNAKVVDYVIVSGSRTRAGAYVAWNCSIETLEVCAIQTPSPLSTELGLISFGLAVHRALSSLFSRGIYTAFLLVYGG